MSPFSNIGRQRRRNITKRKLMPVLVVILSLAPIFFESGIGNNVMEPSLCDKRNHHSIAILILPPVLFAMLKERALHDRTLRQSA